jgi:hypothetical protein
LLIIASKRKRSGEKRTNLLEDTNSPSNTGITTGDNSFLTLELTSSLVLRTIGKCKVERFGIHRPLFSWPFGLSLFGDVLGKVAGTILFWDGGRRGHFGYVMFCLMGIGMCSM